MKLYIFEDDHDYEEAKAEKLNYFILRKVLFQVKKGCWHSFTHCLCGMWSTRETLPVNEDKEIVVRTTIR